MTLLTPIAGSASEGGLLDWTADTATDLRPVLQTVAVTVAVLFVIYRAVHSKFSIGNIVVSALAAGVFVWLVFNVTELSDTIGEDLPGGGSPATEAPTTPPGGAPSGASSGG